MHRSTNTWKARASGPPIIPPTQPLVSVAARINKKKTPVTHVPSRCNQTAFFWLSDLFFLKPQSSTLICKCYAALWREKKTKKKTASLSPRCNSLSACIIHVWLWVWGREMGNAAAENHNSGDATNTARNELWLQLHSSKDTFKRRWKRFKPRWELKLTSNLSGVIESICLHRAQLVQSESTYGTIQLISLDQKNTPENSD